MCSVEGCKRRAMFLLIIGFGTSVLKNRFCPIHKEEFKENDYDFEFVSLQ